MKANNAAERRGFEPLVSGQYLYNLIRRDIETEILPACVDQGMGILCWSPLAAGLLTGKHRDAEAAAKADRFRTLEAFVIDRYIKQESMKLVELLCEIAEEEVTPVTVALSWILKEKAVSSVIAGARNLKQFEASLVAGEWDLSEEAYQKLKAKLPHRHGYPHEWMEMALVPNFSKTEDDSLRAQRFSSFGRTVVVA